MKLSDKTLENLRDMVNEKTVYRTGSKLVLFFNQLGFSDEYGPGFPSRSSYTDTKLQIINGTPEIDKCIKSVFAPINFINEEEKLINCIKEFNNYLSFDGWKISVKGKAIEIHRCEGPNIEEKLNKMKNSLCDSETDFLKQVFKDSNIDNLPITETVKPIIQDRMQELERCFKAKAYLSSVIIAGSILEGILLGVAQNYPKEFNQSKSAPITKETEKVKNLHEWSLSDMINVAKDIGLIKEDVKKFSHVLRDFRNYIHPFQQMSTRFSPDEHTAKICFQVLKAAICQINNVSLQSFGLGE